MNSPLKALLLNSFFVGPDSRMAVAGAVIVMWRTLTWELMLVEVFAVTLICEMSTRQFRFKAWKRLMGIASGRLASNERRLLIGMDLCEAVFFSGFIGYVLVRYLTWMDLRLVPLSVFLMIAGLNAATFRRRFPKRRTMIAA